MQMQLHCLVWLSGIALAGAGVAGLQVGVQLPVHKVAFAWHGMAWHEARHSRPGNRDMLPELYQSHMYACVSQGRVLCMVNRAPFEQCGWAPQKTFISVLTD